MRKRFSKEAAKTEAQVFFDEIGFVLDDDQYRDALSMLDLFHFYTRTHQVSQTGTIVLMVRDLFADVSSVCSIDAFDRQISCSSIVPPRQDGNSPLRLFSTRSTTSTKNGLGRILQSEEITGRSM